jgi:DNA-binding NarL/FixJ family response regulator
LEEKIRVMIVEDDPMALKVDMKILEQEDDIEVEQVKPHVVLADINLTNKEDQYGIDIAIELSIKMPGIKIVMLSGLLNEDTVRSTIGLGVASNYLIKSNPERIPQAVRDAYHNVPTVEGTVIEFILRDYQESLKATMNKLTPQHVKILELFYRGYNVEDVAEFLKLEVQSVRNHQQSISKRCLGWKWRFKKLNTIELASRAKVMGLF